MTRDPLVQNGSQSPTQRSPTPHRVVRASAGTGKTYQLSNRYLSLLLHGASPAHILATTFTRKAAGEILGRVLTRLAAAVLDPRQADQLGDELAKDPGSNTRRHTIPPFTWQHLLTRIIGQLDRLAVSTLDSFFNRVVQSFRYELDVPANAQIVDDQHPLAQQLRRQGIDAVLGDDDAQTLVDLLRRLNRDQASRSVTDSIDQLVTRLYDVYRQAPDKEVWSRLSIPPGRLNRVELAEALNALRGLEPQLPKTKSTGHPNRTWSNNWVKSVHAADRRAWGSFLDLTLVEAITHGDDRFAKATIPDLWRRVYGPVIAHARACLLQQVAHQTHATWAMLERFDRHYRRLRREHGLLLYSDLSMKLARDLPSLGDDFLLEVYYRLDGRVSHMLLDEFQDTSLEQWSVIRPIAQEITATGDGSRTFFCVGDQKQAIYGWRGGCAELFDQLDDDLLLTPDAQHHLSVSYRSSQVVLDAVNQVFAGLAANEALIKVQAEADRWHGRFQAHHANDRDQPGFVELVTSPAALVDEARPRTQNDQNDDDTPDEGVPTAVSIHEEFATDRIATITAAAPGRSIGVLVNTNNQVRRFVRLLRRHGIPVSGEGANPITDDPAVCLILSTMKMADHPGDDVAVYHVQHSPLGPVVGLHSAQPGEVQSVTLAIRQAVFNQGYAKLIVTWAQALAGWCDHANAARLGQLIELAQRYDPHASLRPGDFVRYVQSTPVGSVSPATTRVMTINQAKGLEFDIVVLPDLGRDLTRDRDGLVYATREDPTGPVVAVYRACNQTIRTMCPSLQEACRQQVSRGVQDGVSKLYVAMTRARYALHMIIEPLATTKRGGVRSAGWTDASYATILRRALSSVGDGEDFTGGQTVYAHGSRRWADDLQPTSRRPDIVEPEPVSDDQAGRQEIHFVASTKRHCRSWQQARPSSFEVSGTVSVRDLLAVEPSMGRVRGGLIHAWFELIDWIDDLTPPPKDAHLRAVMGGMNTLSSDDWIDEQIQRFKAMLNRPAVREVLSKPVMPDNTHRLDLWKERRFAAHVGGRLVTGAFDRVVVVRQDNRPVRADLIDYKTDSVSKQDLPQRVNHYRPQVEAYRGALAAMLRLKLTDIRARLLFVEPGVCCDL